MISLEVNNQTKIKIDEKFLIKIAQKAGSLLKIKGKNVVSLALVSRKEIQKLNKNYRGIDKPTDVLSFKLNQDYFGEIIVCPDYAKDGVDQLLIHGLLHLAGYHHQNASQRRQIEKLSAKILKN